MHRHIIRALAVVLVAASLALTGCSGSGDNADGKITLRFAWWGNDTRNKLTNEVIAKYEAANPNIKVQAEPGEFASYWNKLATQVAGNDAPDIIQMDEKYISQYGSSGSLLDLEKAGAVTSDFAEGTVDTGRVNGVLYGVNAGVNAFTVLANPALFDAAKTAIPDDKTWTWDSLASTGEAVTKASPKGTYGSLSYAAREPMLRVWLRQQGLDQWTAQGLGFTANDLTGWFENLVKLQKSGAFPTAAESSDDASKSVDQAMGATGKVGLFYYWSNQVTALDKATGQDLKLLRPPSKTGAATDVKLWYKASMLWSASSKTEHPAEVIKFINYLANDTEAGKVLGTERGIPANLKVREAVKADLGASDKKVAAYIEDIEKELGDAAVPTPVGGADFENVLLRYTQEVTFERQTPQAAAEAMFAEVKAKLKS